MEGIAEEEAKPTPVELPFPSLVPTNEKVRKLIEGPSHLLWREPPYPHELRTVLAFAYLLEKHHRKGLDEEDVKKAADLLEWITNLDPKQVKSEKPSRRRTPPPLLSEASKKIFTLQIEDLRSERFVQNPRWQNTLIGMFRRHVVFLGERGIFRQTLRNIKHLEQVVIDSGSQKKDV